MSYISDMKISRNRPRQGFKGACIYNRQRDAIWFEKHVKFLYCIDTGLPHFKWVPFRDINQVRQNEIVLTT